MEEEVCRYQNLGFVSTKRHAGKGIYTKNATISTSAKSLMSVIKDILSYVRYIQEGYCVFEETCDYLHRENELSSDQKILKE